MKYIRLTCLAMLLYYFCEFAYRCHSMARLILWAGPDENTAARISEALSLHTWLVVLGVCLAINVAIHLAITLNKNR